MYSIKQRAFSHAFQDLPSSSQDKLHVNHTVSQRALNPAAGLVSPHEKSLFKSEYVFDWEINEEFVYHAVSRCTLLDRGVRQYADLENENTLSSARYQALYPALRRIRHCSLFCYKEM